MFVFSFGGRSGKFVLDANGQPLMFPHQDLIIKPAICNAGSNRWEIIDESGTKYYFGSTINSRESTSAKPNTSILTTTYTSTWYLDKIVTLNNTDEINISYINGFYSYVNYFFTQGYNHCTNQNLNLRNESVSISINARYISSISTSGGSINFTWNNYREDLPGGKSLRSVVVKNNLDQQVSKINFSYNYFNSSGCSSHLCKRLKLEEIFDLSNRPLFRFTYNELERLPSRDSPSIDYNGLYNFNTSTNWIPGVNGISTGASITPHPARMQADILTKIEERNGGSTEYVYEANSGRLGNHLPETASGNRIRFIYRRDGNGKTQSIRYNYVNDNGSGSGIIFRMPVFGISLITSNGVSRFSKRFSHAYNEFLDVDGIQIGYSRVEEEVIGKGKTIYTFSNYDEYPDTMEGIYGPPFNSVTSFFWKRGNIKSVLIVDNAGKKMKEEIFEYTFTPNLRSKVTGSKKLELQNETSCGPSNLPDIITNYEMNSQKVLLSNKNTSVFDLTDIDNLRKTTTWETYLYQANTYQLIETEVSNYLAGGDKIKTSIKYVTHPDYNAVLPQNCTDQLSSCITQCSSDTCIDNCYMQYDQCLQNTSPLDDNSIVIQHLKTRHAINTIVEKQSWLEKFGSNQKILQSAELKTFKLMANSSVIVPEKMLIANRFSASSIPSSVINSSGQFTYPTFYRVVAEFQGFDQFGNILETTSSDGITSVVTYDSTGTLMLTNTLNPGDWQFKTQMNYIPLVGIIEKIDPNNFSTKIEYDYNNRPRIIRDNEDFIIERIRYNYPDETANFALVSSKNQVLVNEQLVFEIQDVVLPLGGNYTIAWDMGNGSTFNDNRQSVTFSYSSPGLYTIIATMTSDDYPSINRVFQLLVNSPLEVSICADGPLNIDICGTGSVAYGNCTVFNNSPFSGTEFIAQLDGPGCVGFYNYHWEYKRTDHFVWTTFGNGTSRAFFNGGSAFQPTYYEIRCTVTDACESSTVSYSYLYFYESSPSCSGGLGGLNGESDGQNN